jgi:hypothetical protein
VFNIRTLPVSGSDLDDSSVDRSFARDTLRQHLLRASFRGSVGFRAAPVTERDGGERVPVSRGTPNKAIDHSMVEHNEVS